MERWDQQRYDFLAEEVNDIHRFFLSLCIRGRRRKSAKRIIFALLVAAASGGLLGFCVALGQSWSIGFNSAVDLYGNHWLLSPIAGVAALAVIALIFYITLITIYLIDRASRRWLSDIYQEKFYKIRFIIPLVLAASIFLIYAVVMGSEMASRGNPGLSQDDSNDLKSVLVLADTQRQSVTGASHTARNLLQSLEGTETELRRLRGHLRQTLVDLERQDRAAFVSAQRAKNLLQRQQQIELRTKEVERLLDGKSIITRSDLEQSSWQGLLLGSFLGFIMSLAAAFVFELISRRRRHQPR